MIRFPFVLLVGALLAGLVEADPIIAFSNLPNSGNYTPGGSLIDDVNWKALLFTTPMSSRAEIVSVQVALGSRDCPTPRSGQTCSYPSSGDVQVSLYSVTNIAGVPTPNTELQSVPLQSVTLPTAPTLQTFSLPNWPLEANTNYALVLKSSSSNPIKWNRVEVGGNGDYIPPTAGNGFSFSADASSTSPTPPHEWISTGNNCNGVIMNVVLYSVVPSLSEWTQSLLALMTITLVGWHFYRERSY